MDISSILLEIFNDLLEFLEETKREMAIRKVEPVSILASFSDFLPCLSGLALAERDWHKLGILEISELL